VRGFFRHPHLTSPSPEGEEYFYLMLLCHSRLPAAVRRKRESRNMDPRLKHAGMTFFEGHFTTPSFFRTSASFFSFSGLISQRGIRSSGLIFFIMPSAVFTGIGFVSMNTVLEIG
jgi:hypothetical protein